MDGISPLLPQTHDDGAKSSHAMKVLSDTESILHSAQCAANITR